MVSNFKGYIPERETVVTEGTFEQAPALKKFVGYKTLELAGDIAKKEAATNYNSISPEAADPLEDKLGEAILGDNPLNAKYNRLFAGLPDNVKPILGQRVAGLGTDLDKKIRVAESLYKEYKIKPEEEAQEEAEGFKAVGESFNIAKESIKNDSLAAIITGDPILGQTALGANVNDQLKYDYKLVIEPGLFGTPLEKTIKTEKTPEKQREAKIRALDNALFERNLLNARQQKLSQVEGAEGLARDVAALGGSIFGYQQAGAELVGPGPQMGVGFSLASYAQGKGDILLSMYEQGIDILDNRDAQITATIGGTAYAALEKMQAGKIIDKVSPGLSKKLISKTMGEAFKKGAIKYVADIGENVIQEGGQAIATKMSEDIIKMQNAGLSAKEITKMLLDNSDRYGKAFMDEMQTAGAFAVVGLPGASAQTVRAMKTADKMTTDIASATGMDKKEVTKTIAGLEKAAINVEKAKEVLNNAGLNGEEIVKVVDEIRTDAGVEAEGRVVGDIIELTKLAKTDIAGEHEAFHYLSKQYGNSGEYQAALQEVIEREGTDEQNAQEILADEFAKWRKDKGVGTSTARRFFSSFTDNVKGVFVKNKETMKLFKAFNEGKIEKAPLDTKEESVFKRALSADEEAARKIVLREQRRERSKRIKQVKESTPSLMKFAEQLREEDMAKQKEGGRRIEDGETLAEPSMRDEDILKYSDNGARKLNKEDYINIARERMEKAISNPRILREDPKAQGDVINYLIEENRTEELKALYLAEPEIILGLENRGEATKKLWQVLEGKTLEQIAKEQKQKEYAARIKNTSSKQEISRLKAKSKIEAAYAKRVVAQRVREAEKRTGKSMEKVISKMQRQYGDVLTKERDVAFTERARKEKQLAGKSQELMQQKEKTSIAMRTGELKGAIEGRKQGIRIGKREQQLKQKEKATVARARQKIFNMVKNFNKLLKNKAFDYESGKQIMSLIGKHLDVGILRSIADLESDYAIRMAGRSPEGIARRSDGSIWFQPGTDVDNRFQKKQLISVLNKLSDAELFQLWNDISYIAEIGRLKMDIKKQAEQRDIESATNYIQSGINEATQTPLFKVRTNFDIFQQQEEKNVIEKVNKVMEIEGVEVGAPTKASKVLQALFVWNNAKKNSIALLNPLIMAELVDVDRTTLRDFLWDSLVEPEHTRDILIKQANAIWRKTYVEVSKKRDLKEYQSFRDGRFKTKLTAVQQVMIAGYMENEWSRRILENNNTDEKKAKPHNYLTKNILKAIVEKVGADKDLTALKEATMKAIDSNFEQVIQVHSEVNNGLVNRENNYLSYKLQRVKDGDLDVQNYADTLFGMTEGNWDKTDERIKNRKTMLKSRQVHDHPIEIKDVDFQQLIERTIEAQARFIAYEPQFKRVKQVMVNLRDTLDKKYGSDYIYHQLNNYVNDVLFGEEFSNDWISGLLRTLRKATYSSQLMGNLKSAAKQVGGALTAMSYVGVPEVARGLSMVNSKAKRNMAMEKSLVLNTRMVHYDQAEFEKALTGYPKIQTVKQLSMMPITIADQVVATAVWLGAYEASRQRSLELSQTVTDITDDMIERNAIRDADMAVAFTQNMSSTLFKPAAVRSSELAKNIFMYGSQGFQVYSLGKLYRQQLRAGILNPFRYLWKMILLFLLPGLWNEFVSSGGKTPLGQDPMGSLADTAITSVSEAHPLLRIFGSAVQYDKSVVEMASLSFTTDAIRAVQELTKQDYGQALRRAAMAGGKVRGWNTSLIDTAASGIFDLATGETKDIRRLIYRQSVIGKNWDDVQTPKQFKSALSRERKNLKEIKDPMLRREYAAIIEERSSEARNRLKERR